jgi:hypothetical protein
MLVKTMELASSMALPKFAFAKTAGTDRFVRKATILVMQCQISVTPAASVYLWYRATSVIVQLEKLERTVNKTSTTSAMSPYQADVRSCQ